MRGRGLSNVSGMILSFLFIVTYFADVCKLYFHGVEIESSFPARSMVPRRMGHEKKHIGGMADIRKAFFRSCSGPGGVPL